jgi:hypothetical protein
MGFFSIHAGKRVLSDIINSGEAVQTPAETEATIREIETSGLEDKKPGELTEKQLADFASDLKEFPRRDHAYMAEAAILDGDFSRDEGQKILTLAGLAGN